MVVHAPTGRTTSAAGETWTTPIVLFHLLTPLGVAYEKAVEHYKPYDRIVEPQPRVRQETVALVRQAVAEGTSPYVLANNQAEGCVPQTIQAIVAGLST